MDVLSNDELRKLVLTWLCRYDADPACVKKILADYVKDGLTDIQTLKDMIEECCEYVDRPELISVLHEAINQ